MNENQKSVIDMYKSGMKVSQISNELELSLVYIYHILRHNKIKLRKRELANKRPDIIQMYKQGLNAKQIADKLNRTPTYVYIVLRRQNIKLRKYVSEKITASYVANKLRISRQTLYNKHHKGVLDINKLIALYEAKRSK